MHFFEESLQPQCSVSKMYFAPGEVFFIVVILRADIIVFLLHYFFFCGTRRWISNSINDAHGFRINYVFYRQFIFLKQYSGYIYRLLGSRINLNVTTSHVIYMEILFCTPICLSIKNLRRTNFDKLVFNITTSITYYIHVIYLFGCK